MRALLAVPVVCSLACEQPQKQQPAPTLLAVPLPDLAGADPSVRQQLMAGRRALDAELAASARGPELAGAFGRMGQLYHTYDMLEPAEVCYRNAHELAPDSYRWLAHLGAVYQKRGRLAEAAEAYRAALVSGPPEASLLLHLGQVELARNDPRVAGEQFSAALEADPSCTAALFGLGEAARAEGDYAAAAEHFRRTLEAQPEATQVHYPLGQTLLRLGHKEEGEDQLRRAAGREVSAGAVPGCADPLDAELAELKTGVAAHLRLAREANYAGDVVRELDEYRKAVAADPGDAVARQGLGSGLFRSGAFEEAHLEYAEAQRLSPESPGLHSDLGIVAVRLSRLEDAERHFRRALELDPDSVLYRLQLASLARRRGRCAEAIALFDAVLATEPANRQARSQRALCLAQLGRQAEAASELANLIEEQPPEAPAERLQVAALLLSLGGSETALGHFRAVLARPAPAQVHARAHLLIGQVHLGRGEAQRAAESFGAAVRLDPGLAEEVTALERQ